MRHIEEIRILRSYELSMNAVQQLIAACPKLRSVFMIYDLDYHMIINYHVMTNMTMTTTDIISVSRVLAEMEGTIS